jgi:hypothetical protein
MAPEEVVQCSLLVAILAPGEPSPITLVSKGIQVLHEYFGRHVLYHNDQINFWICQLPSDPFFEIRLLNVPKTTIHETISFVS